MKEPARVLAQQYNAITIGGALALVVLVTVLFFLQFNDLKKNQLQRLNDKLNDRADALDSVLQTTAFYVKQLRNAAQYHMRQDFGGDELGGLAALPRDYENGRYFAIDDLPPGFNHEDVGNLFGLGSYNERIKGSEAEEIRAALKLFPLFKVTHESLPNIALSYYQSINHFTAMFPWTTTTEMTDREPGLTIEQLIDGVIEMDLVKKGRPENNSKREAYWTPVYLDPAGQGLMVTHGAPVYQGNRFMGVVGADITLDALVDFMDNMDYENGHMYVVNEYNQVLATTAGAAFTEDGARSLKDWLPKPLKTEIEDVLSGGRPHEIAGFVVGRERLNSSPWSLLFILPRGDLNRLSFYGILGYVFIVLGLSLFLIMVYILLQRRFVRPAIALTDHIRAEAADGQSHVKDVPALWRSWFQTVSDTFALKHVTSNLPGAAYQVRQESNGNLRVTFISNAIQNLVGKSPDAFMHGRINLREILLAQDLPEFRKSLQESAKNLSHFHFQCQVCNTMRKEPTWVRFASNPRLDNEGMVIWEGLILDITKRKIAELALRASEQRLRSIMDASLFPLVVSRVEDNRLAFINDRGLELFRLDAQKAKGLFGATYWVNPSQRAEVLTEIKDKGKVENIEVQMRREDGETFWVLMSAIRMIYEDLPSLLFTYTDITRRKELESELKKLATTDGLTGANNRRYFLELGEREWYRARRGVNPLSVLMMDIDHFKKINDTYGHPAGDEALRQVVQVISAKIRNIDILGRLGGEEFSVILPNADLDTAHRIGDRLRESISEIMFLWEGKEIRFTVSVGVSQYRDTDINLDAVMNRSDQALYKAKTGGRNQVVVM